MWQNEKRTVLVVTEREHLHLDKREAKATTAVNYVFQNAL